MIPQSSAETAVVEVVVVAAAMGPMQMILERDTEMVEHYPPSLTYLTNSYYTIVVVVVRTEHLLALEEEQQVQAVNQN